jgi:rhamnosyltransferase
VHKTTIVMRTKNSDWVIRETLEALFSQSYTDFELLVVDSGSTDTTLDIVRDYPHRLVEIEASSYYPGPVLNMAFEQATTPLCVLLNSDSVMLSTESLQELVSSFDDPKVCAAYGRQLPRPEATPWVRRDYAASFPQKDAVPWIGLSFPLAAMRRKTWQERPFYQDSWGSEDTEWGIWARRSGREVRYIPEALTMHSHNYTFRQLHGRRFIEGEADAFIHADRPPSFHRGLGRAIKDGFRDVPGCFRAGQFWRAPEAFARRVAGEWAYLLGNRHGAKRKAEGGDASFGQSVVLNRY